ncbi:tRNA (cytidine(34)-2'-O)-methyltransferase [Niveispirillum cyanobacteriorum]|uniref:tRNA (cytidine(34)-2'-O)-methyltransferase n=1 Tax=Niveispirillum cyanobacteriorum TaxID=1612173 RepID=A0A2K9NBH7_9PROT|nr:tRNA (cytidine(34)-2'-O)-methyltransferase [Niveispirillum cyanobacteriorum]AUN30439.1 tRNA methyltransferase [Niveispirillum cyanobacteriorum]GGE54622.1 tRNA (cytidine(34)-2'-O)-methyltransferase [Niveispirillum cyanobacteriorum]
MPRLALYQPDIPQNAGTLMRLGACTGVGLDIIEPCGFILDDKRMRRSVMDYADHADVTRHVSWAAFQAQRRGRLVLLTTRAAVPYTQVTYQPDDILLLGRESAGVPDDVHDAADLRVLIPMRPGTRSLNVAIAASMVLGEVLRQVDTPERQTIISSGDGKG